MVTITSIYPYNPPPPSCYCQVSSEMFRVNHLNNKPQNERFVCIYILLCFVIEINTLLCLFMYFSITNLLSRKKTNKYTLNVKNFYVLSKLCFSVRAKNKTYSLYWLYIVNQPSYKMVCSYLGSLLKNCHSRSQLFNRNFPFIHPIVE